MCPTSRDINIKEREGEKESARKREKDFFWRWGVIKDTEQYSATQE